MEPSFYFATCQTGAEKAVKTEVAILCPQLKFAFSRPGFITFKSLTPIQNPKSVFARLWGTVIGQAKNLDDCIALLQTIPDGAIVHTFERDQFVPGDEPDHFVKNERINALVHSLPKLFKDKFKWNAEPRLSESVYDLIWLDDFHVFLGKHIHSEKLCPEPGNQPQIELPATSPSRAALKILEAITRFHPELKKGTEVLEIGCSPGGATLAMLKHGFQVTGIDPKRMVDEIYKEPGFKSIQKTAESVTLKELAHINPDWIVMDMNIAPLEAIDELAHILDCLRKNFGRSLKIKYGFLTIKLNDWKFAQSIPLYMKRLQECGFDQMTATQLLYNRQEFFVFAKKFHV